MSKLINTSCKKLLSGLGTTLLCFAGLGLVIYWLATLNNTTDIITNYLCEYNNKSYKCNFNTSYNDNIINFNMLNNNIDTCVLTMNIGNEKFIDNWDKRANNINYVINNIDCDFLLIQEVRTIKFGNLILYLSINNFTLPYNNIFYKERSNASINDTESLLIASNYSFDKKYNLLFDNSQTGELNRIILCVLSNINNQSLLLCNVHFSPQQYLNKLQYTYLKFFIYYIYVKDNISVVFIGGDFNNYYWSNYSAFSNLINLNTQYCTYFPKNETCSKLDRAYSNINGYSIPQYNLENKSLDITISDHSYLLLFL